MNSIFYSVLFLMSVFFLCLKLPCLAQNSIKIEWQKTLGGSSNDPGSGLISARNGDLIAFGSTRSQDGDIDSLKGIYDVFVSRVSVDGVKKWTETYGEA